MFLLEQKPKMGFHNSVPLEPLLMRERSRDGGRGPSVMESIFIAVVITVILCRRMSGLRDTKWSFVRSRGWRIRCSQENLLEVDKRFYVSWSGAVMELIMFALGKRTEQLKSLKGRQQITWMWSFSKKWKDDRLKTNPCKTCLWGDMCAHVHRCTYTCVEATGPPQEAVYLVFWDRISHGDLRQADGTRLASGPHLPISSSPVLRFQVHPTTASFFVGTGMELGA